MSGEKGVKYYEFGILTRGGEEERKMNHKNDPPIYFTP
jgi:hypothetical protein